MPTIAEVRQQFPQYSDMPDDALAAALHQKFYPDMNRDEFNQKIGLAPAAPVATPAPAEWSPTGQPRLLNAAKNVVETAKNVPASAAQLVTDTVHPILHPIETAENIGAIGKGVLQKFGIMSGDSHEKYADAVGQFFKDRYGGMDNIAKTLQEDPVGALADLSTVLTGGGTLAGRVPGAAGKVGKVVADVGKAVDPISAAAKATGAAARVGTEIVGGMATGTGGKAINEAFSAGLKAITDPEQGKAFRDNYFKSRGVDPAEVVAQAKGAVDALVQERGKEYRAAMKEVGKDTEVLDFTKVDKALADSLNIDNFKGVDLKPETKGVRDQIVTAINDWKALDPKEFHTAEGMDALKKMIGGIVDAPGNRDAFGRLTSSGVVADRAYKAVRQTIIDQFPEYAKIMKGYEAASLVINNLQRELSLGKNANIDTGLRKLQSVLRNNVTANYGRREVLAEFLKDAGADTLLAALAGQSLSSIIPRGLAAKVLTGIEGIGAGAAAGVGAVGLGAALPVLGGLALSSPKLVGGAAHLGGIALSPINVAPHLAGLGAFHAGRSSLRSQ